MASAKSAIGQLQWFADALSSDAGMRSKSLKVVQYSAKLYVWAHANGLVAETKGDKTAQRSAKSLAKALSLSRKVMNLGDCISDFFEMRECVRSAWAEPGNPHRVRTAVASASDFVCDATTDWMLLASMTGRDAVSMASSRRLLAAPWRRRVAVLGRSPGQIAAAHAWRAPRHPATPAPALPRSRFLSGWSVRTTCRGA